MIHLQIWKTDLLTIFVKTNDFFELSVSKLQRLTTVVIGYIGNQ